MELNQELEPEEEVVQKLTEAPLGSSTVSKEVQLAAGAISVEERCPICLEDFEDKAFVDACFHSFCFQCIVRWAESTTSSCPLCKTVFRKIIHNVRANDDYDVFKVVAKPASESNNEVVIDLEAALRNFRGYRTTRFPGQPSESRPLTTVIRPYPLRHRRRQRTDTRKPASIQRRRAVYSTGVRAQPLTSGAGLRRVRDISASFFRRNPAACHRLYTWLSRELMAILGEEHVQFITQIIISVIDKVDLASDEFHSYLEPYLHEKTAHFMHELTSFASSPFDMIAYDQNVTYDWPDRHPEHATQRRKETTPPGPSSSVQQRIFDEISSTSWDDPPPILETTSPSFLDHSSDSDYQGTDNNTPQRNAVIVISDEESRDTVLSQSGYAETAINLETEELTSLETNEGVIILEPERLEANQEGVINLEIDAAKNIEIKTNLDNTSENIASSSGLQDRHGQISVDSPDYEIQIFANESSFNDCEPPDELPTSSHKEHDESHTHRNRKQSKHRSRHHHDTTRSTDRKHYKKVESKRKKVESKDDKDELKKERLKSKKDHRTRHRSHSRDRSRKSSRKYSHDGGHDSISYKNNSHRKHRTRSHSRDRDRHNHVSYEKGKINSPQQSTSSNTISRETFTEDSGHKTASMPSSGTSTSIQLNDDRETKALSNELNGLEKQITDNKRDLLKSLLRRERIELLQNSLHPSPHPSILQTTSRLQSEEEMSSIQRELCSLETAILDEKKHLLRVMKRIEEDKADDSD